MMVSWCGTPVLVGGGADARGGGMVLFVFVRVYMMTMAVVVGW